MATYQFLTFVLPRKPIEKKYGGIPKQLEIKHAEWEKYWDNWNMKLNEAPEPEFEDAISTKWWKEIQINIAELRDEIDKIIPRASWNNESWKIENGEVDHDLSIDYNEKENFIEDFRFRTDLRDSELNFLNSMLELCDRNDWILMDEDGNLCNPNIKELAELLKISKAHLYITNPTKFFEDWE
ncbi:hypothetical protein [Polaribacter cellanae]|uniref:Uncharacterized protein n=1 Tax=Polaribacter cellanae TaxID=2818493 RepID=A0A975CM19_9FLAO|nr:hypothetical protein [Polaribacter cellanae]QTE21799.1 hypothetical protein J3359_13375 [Polaribacter cellanae]